MLRDERGRTLRDIGELALSVLTLELQATRAVTEFAHAAVRGIGGATRGGDGGAGFFFHRDRRAQHLARLGERFGALRFLGLRGLSFVTNAIAKGRPLSALLRRTLATGQRIAVPLFGHREFLLQLEYGLTRGGRDGGTLVTRRLGGGTRSLGEVTCGFGFAHGLLARGEGIAQAPEALVEVGELGLPRGHLARGKGELHRKATGRDFGGLLRATALTQQRAHLRLYFAREVVDANEICTRGLKLTLGAATTIAIEPNASGLFEQFAAVVRTIGQ